jgi:hypothetical protein
MQMQPSFKALAGLLILARREYHASRASFFFPAAAGFKLYLHCDCGAFLCGLREPRASASAVCVSCLLDRQLFPSLF